MGRVLNSIHAYSNTFYNGCSIIFRNSVPDNMIINGLECSDKQAIAEHFNSFFATVGELNSRNITEHNDSSYRDYLSERIESSFEF